MPKKSKPNLSDETRGALAFEKGHAFEIKLGTILCGYCDKETKKALRDTIPKTAGAGHGDDVVFSWKGRDIGIEAKNLGTQEGGQRAFALIEGKLQIPDLPKNAVHRAMLAGYKTDFLPYNGQIPSFKRGDLTSETWLREKEKFKDQYFDCDPKAISDYYRTKGSAYIQVEGKGLYHTGVDPCGFGVPFFECPTRIRIRCKVHHGKVPTSVTAALNYNKKKLRASPFCLIRGPLPSCLEKSVQKVEDVRLASAKDGERHDEGGGEQPQDGVEDGKQSDLSGSIA